MKLLLRITTSLQVRLLSTSYHKVHDKKKIKLQLKYNTTQNQSTNPFMADVL